MQQTRKRSLFHAKERLCAHRAATDRIRGCAAWLSTVMSGDRCWSYRNTCQFIDQRQQLEFQSTEACAPPHNLLTAVQTNSKSKLVCAPLQVLLQTFISLNEPSRVEMKNCASTVKRCGKYLCKYSKLEIYGYLLYLISVRFKFKLPETNSVLCFHHTGPLCLTKQCFVSSDHLSRV